MKKFLSALVAACVMAVCTQPAFAISKAEITNVNPNDNSATYLGDGLYLIDNGNDDGEYREGKNSTIVDAAAFSKVKTIAVAPLLYSPNKNDPSWKEAMDTVLAASNEFNKNGDIIVVKLPKNQWHLMVYLGEGKAIHCPGHTCNEIIHYDIYKNRIKGVFRYG